MSSAGPLSWSRRSSKVPMTTTPAAPRTVWSAFIGTATTSANAVALNRWVPTKVTPAPPSSTTPIAAGYSWGEYAEKVTAVARSFVAADVCVGDAVLFQMHANSIACTVLNMGVIGAGALVCHWRVQLIEVQTLWTDYAPFKWIVTDAAHLLPDYVLLPRLTGVVFLGSSRTVLPQTDVPIYSLEQFLELGKIHPASVDVVQGHVRPSDPCILAYQYSPDGQLCRYALTHDNILFTAGQLASGLQVDLGPCDRIIAYLPLHFVTSQIIEWYLPVALNGGPVLYCVEGDGSSSTLKHIQPTLFFGTPATWITLGRQLAAIKAQAHSIFYSWAKTRAVHHAEKLQVGAARGKGKQSLGHTLANKLVLSSMKKKLGLDSCRFCGVVLAKLAFDKIELFSTVDLPLYQLDGAVETSGFASVNAPHAWALGSSGKPLPGTVITLAEAAHSTEYQICYKGRNVCPQMLGVDDAWHSYQYGGLNPFGFVVVNHHKDFVILSTGERIPPAPYEIMLLKRAPYLQRAVVVGDGQAYLTVLLVLKTKKDKLVDEAIEKGRTLGSKALTVAEVARCPVWAVALDQLLDQINQAPHGSDPAGQSRSSGAVLSAEIGSGVNLAAVFPLMKWLLLPQDFSVATGEVRVEIDKPVLQRHIVAVKHEKLIETLY
ncbi:long-chain-fatty-acid-CoA ligase [Achlya hypogyna]|uniref:Long-chain-fatty-acid-CoA ligase n=1 Tax=Achlya hypogyna TaxID=1202772 RepID=A0A1V9ZTA7_ACHHY|nr:long-chain-fatty-acid-CoA ligase [Achlya hypogyna]